MTRAFKGLGWGFWRRHVIFVLTPGNAHIHRLTMTHVQQGEGCTTRNTKEHMRLDWPDLMSQKRKQKRYSPAVDCIEHGLVGRVIVTVERSIVDTEAIAPECEIASYLFKIKRFAISGLKRRKGAGSTYGFQGQLFMRLWSSRVDEFGGFFFTTEFVSRSFKKRRLILSGGGVVFVRCRAAPNESE